MSEFCGGAAAGAQACISPPPPGRPRGSVGWQCAVRCCPAVELHKQMQVLTDAASSRQHTCEGGERREGVDRLAPPPAVRWRKVASCCSAVGWLQLSAHTHDTHSSSQVCPQNAVLKTFHRCQREVLPAHTAVSQAVLQTPHPYALLLHHKEPTNNRHPTPTHPSTSHLLLCCLNSPRAVSSQDYHHEKVSQAVHNVRPKCCLLRKLSSRQAFIAHPYALLLHHKGPTTDLPLSTSCLLHCCSIPPPDTHDFFPGLSA
jgi:hypothetical protein